MARRMSSSDITARKVSFTRRGAEIREFALREPREGEMLVKARCSLISIGTETTLYVKSRWEKGAEAGDAGEPPEEGEWDFESYGKGDAWDMDTNRRYPGYALAGDVVAVGVGVADFSVGDRVISLHHHSSHAICSAKPFITLKIPDGVSYEDSTFSVLGSVALHAIRRAKLTLGEDVVVMGAGLVGLLTLQLARLSGAYPVISVDLSPRRLEVARKVGAHHTINPNSEDLVRLVREYVGGEGASCTIEAVGNPKVLQSCMEVSAPGARVVIMGAIVGEVGLDMYREFVFKELNLIASQQPRNPVQDTIYYHYTGQRNRQTILGMIQRKTLNVKDLLTHRFPYREAPEVYAMLGSAKNADYDARGDVNRDMIGVLLDWDAD